MQVNTILVSNAPPGERSFGGGQRTHRLLDALRRLGQIRVLVVSDNAAAQSGSPGPIAEVSDSGRAGVMYYATRRDAASVFRALCHANQPDVVVVRPLGADVAVGRYGRVPRVVDADDALYRYAPAGPGPLQSGFAYSKSLLRHAMTGRRLRSFDHCWLVSERACQKFPRVRSSVLPNVVAVPDEVRRSVPESPRLLFVGALWYPPNLTGLRWFLQNCWATIRSSVPGAVLRLVGGGPVGLRTELARVAGVEVIGQVPELRPHYEQASAAIAPIWFGGGTQIKVIEALSYGVPCVATSFVRDGYAGVLDSGCGLMDAGSAAEFSARCVQLLREGSLAREVGIRGRERVAERFSEGVFFSEVERTLTRLLA